MKSMTPPEAARGPGRRIAGIDETADGIVITTTDIHLPRGLGEALRRALRGGLEMPFAENGYFARIDWHPPP